MRSIKTKRYSTFYHKLLMKDLFGDYNTLKKRKRGKNVSKIDHVANESLDDSFFHLVKKGDN